MAFSNLRNGNQLFILHKDIIKGCDEILMQLNPEIQERQRQEAENKALREEVNSLKEMFKEFMKSWQQ